MISEIQAAHDQKTDITGGGSNSGRNTNANNTGPTPASTGKGRVQCCQD